jgi:hypothetical protein
MPQISGERHCGGTAQRFAQHAQPSILRLYDQMTAGGQSLLGVYYATDGELLTRFKMDREKSDFAQ